MIYKTPIIETDRFILKTGGGVAKTLLKVVGVGLAAGVALIAATDKTMNAAFPQPEPEDDCDEASEVQEL